MPYYEIVHVEVSSRIVFKHIDVILTPIPKLHCNDVLTIEFRQPLNSYINCMLKQHSRITINNPINEDTTLIYVNLYKQKFMMVMEH